jgi:hypothetical protein
MTRPPSGGIMQSKVEHSAGQQNDLNALSTSENSTTR